MSTVISTEKQRGFKEYLFRESNQNRMKMALPKHITADKMAAVAFTAMVRSPALFDCSYESVLDSLLQLSQLGLLADGRLAAIVPFNGVAKPMPMYQGLVHLAYQSNMVMECFGSAVREKDHFEWEMGTSSYIKYRPFDGEGGAGKLTHAWAMVKLKGGGAPFVVLNRSEVMAAKGVSKTSKRSDSPWNNPDTEPAMWAKTAFRRLAKWIPQSPDLLAAIQMDDDADSFMQVDGVGTNGRNVGSLDDLTARLSDQEPPPPTQPADYTSDALDQLALDLHNAKQPAEVEALRKLFKASDPDEDAVRNQLCDQRAAELKKGGAK